MPFGCWPSTLTPEAMAASSRRIAAPWLDRTLDGETTLTWAESRPEQGRTTLMQRRGSRTAVELVAAPWDVGSRVHEYGGRAHVTDGERLVFVHRLDHSVWLRRDEGAPVCILDGGLARIAEPVFDPPRDRIIAIAELAREGAEPEAAIVAIPLASGHSATPPVVLRRGADFYGAPAPSRDGRHLAWIEWSHPHMPWDASAVHRGELAADGSIAHARHVAGDATASAQQPTWADDGALFFLWERDGAWTIFREDGGDVRCVVASRDELGGPLWNLGMRTWGLVDEGRALAVRVRDGVADLVRIELDDGTIHSLSSATPSIGHLAVGRGVAAMVEGWDGRGVSLSLLDRDGVTTFTRDTGAFAVLAPEGWSHPRAVAFATSHGDTAHAWYYAPHHESCVGPAGARPPVVVVAHGGPTGLALASSNLPVQFWTSRGFAVLDVNYRGSTGYGRAYRERLRGMWGVFDVDDCVAATTWACAEGLADPARTIIRGTSAGGFTVLSALAFHDRFRAGASHYGVSDVAALLEHTHKFESRYDAYLFGAHDAELLRRRSPRFAADRITAPVIFFQGADDPVVPQAQTDMMAAALRERGIEVEVHTYAGEGHGFRRPESIIHSWASELQFYRRVLELDA